MFNWEDIGIENDFLFGKVMQNPDICKKLLEIILNQTIERIEYLEEQKTIDLTKDARGIRLDVYIADGQGTVYNIEMQTSYAKELPKRSRYYQGMMDLNLIEKGEPYKKLNDSYVIFICTFDMFGKGRHIYTFKNLCCEDHNLRLGDGTTKIFLNASGTMEDVNDDLKAFLSYVAGQKNNNYFVNKLEQEVKKVKENKDWRRDYMTLQMHYQEKFEEGLERGIEEGKKKGMQEGRKEGMQEGRKEGMKEGMKKGMKEGKLEVIDQMLKEKIPLELIAKVTGFSLDNIKEIQKNTL